MTESELQYAVIEMAGWLGWMVHHDRPAQNRRGDWATHIQGNAGFPDLCMARDGRVIFAEIKSEMGKFSDAQFGWGIAITGGGVGAADTHEYHEWRPSEWLDGTIEKVLKREGNR